MNALNEMTLVRLNPGLRILVETTSISHNRAVLEKRKLSGFDSLWMLISFSMSTGHNGLLSRMALKWTCQGASCLHLKRLFKSKPYIPRLLWPVPLFLLFEVCKHQFRKWEEGEDKSQKNLGLSISLVQGITMGNF